MLMCRAPLKSPIGRFILIPPRIPDFLVSRSLVDFQEQSVHETTEIAPHLNSDRELP
jgi:hypothetical protein